MKAYVMTTGVVFGLLTLAHIWRAIAEGLAAAALCLWAWRLLRRQVRS